MSTLSSSRAPQPAQKSGAHDARREKLQTIKRREDLKDALVQKFCDKFGSSNRPKDDDLVSLASVNIRREVDGFVGSCAPVTEANLARLERRLWRQAQGKQPADVDSASVCSISAYTTGSAKPGSLSARGAPVRAGRPVTPQSVLGSLSARGPRAVGDAAYSTAYASNPMSGAASEHGESALAQPFDWSSLDKLAAHLHEQDSNSQRARELELQHKLKEDLDRQVADTRLREAREREAEKKYLEVAEQSLKEWKMSEEEKAAKAMEKAKEVKIHREIQLQQRVSKREQERLDGKKEAKELVGRIEKESDEAKELTKQRREIRRELAMQALVESSNCLKQRTKAEQEQLEKEDSSIEAYNKLRNSREQQLKEEAMQKEQQKQQKLDVMVSDRKEAERALKESIEAKAAAEMLAKNEAAVQTEKEKKEKLQEQRLKTQDFLFSQMQANAERKQREREEKQRVATALEGDARAFQESERLRTGAQRARNLEHRAELERQIEAKMSNPARKDAMSSVEASMNKRLLERVSRLEGSVIASVAATGA